MKSPSTNKKLIFRRPAGRLTVLDNNSLVFQVPPNNGSSPLIAPGSLDTVDNPPDRCSLAKILDADVTVERDPIIPPLSDNLPGDYGFNIDFDPTVRDDNYAYSASRDKLYIGKDVPCAVKISVSSPVRRHAEIRVTSIFTQPDQAHFDVHRCMTHALADFGKVDACDHLIHCTSNVASYVRNIITLRRSLIVQYQPPICGLAHSIYVFKFLCLNSCPGGMNRRPIKVIFTLEVGGVVVGRRSFEVKVCLSPLQNVAAEDERFGKIETTLVPKITPSSNRKRKAIDTRDMREALVNFVDMVISSGKDMPNIPTKAPCSIVARDADELDMIKKARSMYGIAQMFRSSLNFPEKPSKKQKKPKDK